MIASGVPFSYTNEHTTEARFMLKIPKNKVEDGELGIFGAEKYFKGAIDEELVKPSYTGVHYCPNRPRETNDEKCPIPKPKTPHSESSWNSRRGLLVSNGPSGNNPSKKTGVKSLLASLGCKCSDKGSVKVAEAKQAVKGGGSGQKAKSLSSKRADEDVKIKREDCFTFPVLNPSMADVKHPELPEVKREREGKKSILDSDINMGQNDTGSDGSSDLFEIESFSTNENNMFLARQAIENNTYAPSEASVDWSVMTASVADFSITEDLGVTRTTKGSGILSGCKSLKAVEVLGDEHGMTQGGEKATVIVPPARREWCKRLDPTTPLARIQADTKLMGPGPGLHVNQDGFGVASSHHLYMKQR